MLFMIVASRVARRMRLGRTALELDAALLFSPEEWRAAYILAKKRPPKGASRRNTLIRLIAVLGGVLGRGCDGEAGMQTLWPGLRRVRDCAEGMRFADGLPAI